MKPTFEYVMSGMSFVLPTQEVFFSDRFKDISSDLMKYLNTEYQNQTFGILFNAYKEIRLGTRMHALWGDQIPIYADSGGLQMVTMGEEITDPGRENVYKNQAHLCNYAMSFDEIPLVTSKNSGVNDRSSRYFEYAVFKDCARQSGVNLRNQIRYFQEHNAICKPMLIAHGNSIDHYQEWVDIILDEVGEENHQYLGGLAFGSGSLGFGQLEDFAKGFIAEKIEAPDSVKKHIHILGVGSCMRMAPFFARSWKGGFEDVKVSYDSTSQSSADSYFAYFMKTKRVSYRKGNMRAIPEIMDDIRDHDSRVGLKHDDLFIREALIKLRSEQDWSQISRFDYDVFKFAIGLYNVSNFQWQIDKIVADPANVIEIIDEKSYHLMNTFKEVEDQKDFNEWKAQVGSRLQSKAISSKMSSLEHLFV